MHARLRKNGRFRLPGLRIILLTLIVVVLLMVLARMSLGRALSSAGESVSEKSNAAFRKPIVEDDTAVAMAVRVTKVAPEFAVQGFLPADSDPVPPEPELPAEQNPDLVFLNAPYHEKRKKLREYQSTHNLGQLRTHTFFTTDCTYHLLWQTLALEYTWDRVQQGGFLTRLASGCQRGTQRTEWWSKSVLSPEVAERRLGTYYVPTFHMEGYSPYNRPNGIWFWLNHTDLTEQIFILIDPDMIFMHRLPVGLVSKGHPAGQYYEYMKDTPYDKFNCSLCPENVSAAFTGPDPHRKANYDVGPPWMLHIEDLRTIMPLWIGLIPPLHSETKMWITEMLAYSLACASHRLPHSVVHDHQVDNENTPGAWDASGALAVNKAGHSATLLHYCYTYEVGTRSEGTPVAQGLHHEALQKRDHEKGFITDYYHFSKYRTPTDWPRGHDNHPHNLLTCNCPIFQEFKTTADSWTYIVSGKDRGLGHQAKRTRVFLDTMLPIFNTVLRKWKRDVLHCRVPTEEEEREYEDAMQRATDKVALYGVRAPERFRSLINLSPLLRTSHPAYWFSEWVAVNMTEDQRNVNTVSAAQWRKIMWAEERRRMSQPN